MHLNRNPRRLLAALMIATAAVAPALLVAAVSAFGRVSGWQVTYPAELGGIRTGAVSGQMAPAQAVNVIGREQMRQQGGSTVTDALRYTPGVVAGSNGGQSGRFDAYFVRGSGGFSAAANNANTMDGLRWRIPSRSGVQFDPWMVERVEVVTGDSYLAARGGLVGGPGVPVEQALVSLRRGLARPGLAQTPGGGRGPGPGDLARAGRLGLERRCARGAGALDPPRAFRRPRSHPAGIEALCRSPAARRAVGRARPRGRGHDRALRPRHPGRGWTRRDGSSPAMR